MARKSPTRRSHSRVIFPDPKRKVQGGITHSESISTVNINNIKMQKKSSSFPVSSPKKILEPRPLETTQTESLPATKIIPNQFLSAEPPLSVLPKTNSKVLPPSDDRTACNLQEQRVFDQGSGPVQPTDIEVACQDVEMEHEPKEDKDGQTKDICSQVSDVILGKVVYGNMEAFMNLLEKSTSLMESEDETGIFMKKDYWFLDPDHRREVLRKKVLGRGSYGIVELYYHKNTEIVKKQVKGELQVNEVSITATLDSPYIIKTYGLTFRQRTATILMENWGKSLLNYARTKKFQETEIWDLTFQGLNGLEYLDQFGIRHHDIKPENLLMIERNGNYLLKLADFGAAKWSTEQCDMEGWTPEYLSPERGWLVLLKRFPQLIPNGDEEKNITGKSDVYSLALSMCFPYQKSHVLLKLMTDGRTKSELNDLNSLKLRMIVTNVENPNLAIENIPDTVGLDMRKLLTKMMCGAVDERLSAGEAKKYMYQLSEEAKTVEKVETPQIAEVISINTQDMVQIVYPLHEGCNQVVDDEPEVLIAESVLPLQPEVPVMAQHVDKNAQTGKVGDQVSTEDVKINQETDIVEMEQGTRVVINSQPEHIEPLYMISTQIESVNIQSPQIDSGSPIFRNSSSRIISQETPVYQLCVKSKNLSSPKKVLIPCFTASGITQSAVKSNVLVNHLGLNRGIHLESDKAPCAEVLDNSASTPSSILANNQDWKNYCDKVSIRNVDALPDSLKSRMIKRKLQNKLPAAKKQKIQAEVQPILSRRGSRQKSREATDLISAGENISSLGSNQSINSFSGNGNMPDFSALF